MAGKIATSGCNGIVGRVSDAIVQLKPMYCEYFYDLNQAIIDIIARIDLIKLYPKKKF